MIKNSRGFTLIELLVIIVTLGILGSYFYKIQTTYSLHQRDLGYKQKAIWVMEDGYELIKSTPFEKIKNDANISFGENAFGSSDQVNINKKISITNISMGLKKITLEVFWFNSSRQERNLTTTIYRFKE